MISPSRVQGHARRLWTAWLAVIGLAVLLAILPVSNTLTRLGCIVMLLAGWSLLAVTFWRSRWMRTLPLALLLFVAVFLILPSRRHQDPELLRRDFISSLRHYEGVRYFWGGEGFTGIDCSGLVRWGLIDSLFSRGVPSFDAGLVRSSICVWWHDCSASDLGESRNGLTIPVLETPSLNVLDYSRIIPGDLAVTKGGEHVMAYIGDKIWIEADPLAHRVITVSAPSATNAWFHGPMKIVRWRILSQ